MLYIVQNDPEVPAGTIAVNLQKWGVPYRVLMPYAGENLPGPDDVTAVIVLGGKMGADDDEKYPFLSDLKRWIRVIVAAEIPFLGICLGGQLLAAVHGGTVHSDRWGERGFCDIELNEAGISDPLFSGLGPMLTGFQWHQDSFDLPPGGTLLAQSTTCPNQAFRIGRNAWGMQFHPEVDLDIITSWCSEETYSDRFHNVMEAAWRSSEKTFASTAGQLLKNFLDMA
jgi:GMP synthase-like glutamine amidotransferase